ncbi:unnamed protein product [Pleuronectes platessa]|uniref:C2H2-type domain-containing protein n=1 Tax=Pleuronectes platessa TaxID=8262 RepID=A0A9N7YFM6_PLEPL|nr:unnamed protein product [Pleuronectes platessa]
MLQHPEEPDVGLKAEAELRATDVQQLMVTDEELPTVEQENPELLHIEEEQDVDAVTASGLKTEESEPQLVLNSLKTIEVPAADVRGKKTYSCSECRESIWPQSTPEDSHENSHGGETIQLPGVWERFHTGSKSDAAHVRPHEGEKVQLRRV